MQSDSVPDLRNPHERGGRAGSPPGLLCGRQWRQAVEAGRGGRQWRQAEEASSLDKATHE